MKPIELIFDKEEINWTAITQRVNSDIAQETKEFLESIKTKEVQQK